VAASRRAILSRSTGDRETDESGLVGAVGAVQTMPPREVADAVSGAADQWLAGQPLQVLAAAEAAPARRSGRHLQSLRLCEKAASRCEPLVISFSLFLRKTSRSLPPKRSGGDGRGRSRRSRRMWRPPTWGLATWRGRHRMRPLAASRRSGSLTPGGRQKRLRWRLRQNPRRLRQRRLPGRRQARRHQASSRPSGILLPVQSLQVNRETPLVQRVTPPRAVFRPPLLS